MKESLRYRLERFPNSDIELIKNKDSIPMSFEIKSNRDQIKRIGINKNTPSSKDLISLIELIDDYGPRSYSLFVDPTLLNSTFEETLKVIGVYSFGIQFGLEANTYNYCSDIEEFSTEFYNKWYNNFGGLNYIRNIRKYTKGRENLLIPNINFDDSKFNREFSLPLNSRMLG